MIDINTALQNLLDAVYGEEVRESMHDGLYQVNQNSLEAVALARIEVDTSITSTTSSSTGYVVGNIVLNSDTWDVWKCTGSNAWALQGNIQGGQGDPGEDGADGSNTYTYIRYSASADGTGFVSTPTSLTIYIGFYAGTSSTAPTDKTEYTWSKYVGESGSGTGDMLKSEFATNGSARVVDTSNRLRKYVITNSGTTYANQWTKVAEVTFTQVYNSVMTNFSVENRNTGRGCGIFSLCVSAGSPINTSFFATIYCISADKNFKQHVGQLKIVYTAPKYELWFQPNDVSQQLGISILNEYGVGFTWLENQPYQATQPTGTVVTATLMEDYIITDLTAETAIVDTDYFMMHDTSAVANRKTLWSAIKSTLKTYFDTLYNNYVLPTASTTVKGGVKVDGTTITITDEVISSVGGSSGTVINDGSSNPIATTNLIDTLTGVVSNTTANQVAGALAVKTLEDRFTYSTTEKVIGTWIDGKSIYRKIYSASGLNLTSSTVIDANFKLSSVDTVIDMKSDFKTSSEYTGNYTDIVTSTVYSVRTRLLETELRIQISNDTVTKYSIIIDYTKP